MPESYPDTAYAAALAMWWLLEGIRLQLRRWLDAAAAQEEAQ